MSATTSRAARGTRSTTETKPRLRADAPTLKKYGCFLPDGDVLCFCNTEPRVKAIRRVTRKESSPNLGREFWACGNWIEESQCGFFLWCDQAEALGRPRTTPPPERRPAWTAPAPRVPAQPPTPTSTSPQKRPRARSPVLVRLAAPAAAPASSPTPSEPRPPVVPESFEDVDFDALDAGLEDEIEDADHPASSSSDSTSPSKKPRFESFSSSGAPRPSPSTPFKPPNSQDSHWQGAATPSTGKPPAPGRFDAIRSDPDQPSHALQRDLFGGGDPGGRQTEARSSPAPVSPSKAAQDDAPSALDSLFAGLSAVSEAAAALGKERDKDARLQVAAKRKEEALRRAVDRAKEETEALRRENERLKERIRLLEEENNELRTR